MGITAQRQTFELTLKSENSQINEKNVRLQLKFYKGFLKQQLIEFFFGMIIGAKRPRLKIHDSCLQEYLPEYYHYLDF
jgi:hypothetical protein